MQSVVQAKDATIAALEERNVVTQERLDLRGFLPSPNSASKVQQDREEIINDLVAVKKFDWKFIEVNVPEILRKLKRRFR
jgi:hypothetical protein